MEIFISLIKLLHVVKSSIYLISQSRATPRKIQWSGDSTVGNTTAVM